VGLRRPIEERHSSAPKRLRDVGLDRVLQVVHLLPIHASRLSNRLLTGLAEVVDDPCDAAHLDANAVETHKGQEFSIDLPIRSPLLRRRPGRHTEQKAENHDAIAKEVRHPALPIA
jgi:hypothetical protein